MSHECPDCGQTCYCNGDIDDCCFNHPKYAMACKHWKQCEQEDDEDNNYETQSPLSGYAPGTK